MSAFITAVRAWLACRILEVALRLVPERWDETQDAIFNLRLTIIGDAEAELRELRK